MPGKPVGTAFAELSLDATPFEAGLKRVNQQLTDGTMKVENAYKLLGTHSATVFDQMRANVVSASNGIKATVGNNSEEIVRIERAAAAKIASINEQQFGKQMSFVESLKANWIAASAAIIAAWAAVNKAIAMMDEAGQALQAESAFKILADQADVNADRMIATMQRLTKETIDDSDMMQKAVKLMTLGFDPAQIERFSAVVLTASQIAGVTAAQAFDELGDAIANRTPKALVRLGAITREQMELVNKAIAGGASEMALYELAMANLEAKQKLLQGTQNESTIALQRFHAEVKNTTEALGKGLLIAAEATYRAFQYLAAGVLGLSAAYARYRALVYRAVGDEEKARENTQFANDAMAARQNLLDAVANAITGQGVSATRASEEEIAASKAVVKEMENKLRVFSQIGQTQKDTEDARKRDLAGWVAYAEEMTRLDELMARYEIESLQTVAKARDDARNQAVQNEYQSLKAQQAIIDEARALGIKFTEDEAKRFADLESEATKQAEQSTELSRQVRLQREGDIRAILDLEQEYLNTQQRNYDAMWDMQIKMANAIGNQEGLGLAQIGTAWKAWMDMQYSTDIYSKQYEQAVNHYQNMVALWEMGAATHAEIQQAQNNLILANDSAMHQQRIHQYTIASQLITGILNIASAVVGKNNTIMFALQKAAAIATTIISAHAAAAAAVAPPPLGLGPVAGVPLAASMLSFGYLQAGIIGAVALAQGIGGAAAGGGGGVPSIGGYALTQPTATTYETPVEQPVSRVYNITILGNVVDQDAFARDLMDSIRKAEEDRA